MADSEKITLLPGELWFGKAPVTLSTVLGSCVAITLWHPQRRLGGMCHYLLSRVDKHRSPDCQPGRYATDAAAWLCERIARHGTRPQEYQAKMFGGGNMFPDVTGGRAPSVAQANIVDGLAIFERLGFQIQSKDVGGNRFRAVTLQVESGEVWVRYGPERRGGAGAARRAR